MRILIVKTSSMGDIVHALPMVSDIARARPDAVIDWVCEESFAALPRMSTHVREVRRVALRRWRKQLLSCSTWREIDTARGELRAARYDLVIDCQGLLKSALVSRWAGAPVAGFATGSARERIAPWFYQRSFSIAYELPALQRCRELAAQALGYELAGPPRFDLKARATPARVCEGDSAVLLVNASRATKLWPEERWVELGRWLAAQGMRSLLYWGSPAEGERARRIAAQIDGAVVAPRAGLDAIAASLSGARLVVGLDTGLTHLGAALGRPCVGIFCDYPLERVALVGDGPVASLGGVNVQPLTAEVIAACERVLA
ncbi:MAG: lipopolysaccharide heptosyltransferase I [Burkholderiaceae bacterium]